MKIWTVPKLNRDTAREIAEKAAIPQIAAYVLAARGAQSAESALKKLPNGGELIDPFLMKDMQKAANRISAAMEECERICVYGDYDADGVCATALLFSYLSDMGADVFYYIPSRRDEGYGMNEAAVKKIAEMNTSLIITVDNGISAVDEIDLALSLGVDTVVTDHHKPDVALPNAAAIINPHRHDCQYPFKELSGVGVAFKLVAALAGEGVSQEELLYEYADIISIGTVGDVVPLVGENRIFVQKGIECMKNRQRVGIKALLECCAIDPDGINSEKIAYSIVPRINACGRLGESQTALELLLAEDEDVALQLAEELCLENSNRRSVEADIMAKACEIIENDSKIKNRSIIVVSGNDWNTGVVGIVASRLKELYGKPTIVIGVSNKLAKGSGRSIKGFSLVDAVFACRDILLNFGGHPMAVGVTLKEDNIKAFSDMINSYADSIGSMPFQELNIDLKLNPAVIDVQLVKELKYLEPYGAGNPQPLFGIYNMRLVSVTEVGGGKHLRLVLSRDESYITVMYFSHTRDEFIFEPGDILDLAVTLEINLYNDMESVSFILRDVKLRDENFEECLKSVRIYEKMIINRPLGADELKSILPTREDFVLVYKKIKGAKLKTRLSSLCCSFGGALSCGKIKVILQALEELSLIECNSKGEILSLNALSYSGKADLSSAPIIKKIHNALNGGIG